MPRFKAAIFDLDGVITRTADVHARAWKRMFDEFLRARGQPPFDVEGDYRTYVDGKPRHDGVRSFLASRGIGLPEGEPGDPPGSNTVRGLGNRKNEIFRDILESEGVGTFDDAVEQLRTWRGAGVKTAVVSSSRNCVAVLEAAGLLELFDAKVDGVDSIRLGLDGKPAPDIFLKAAEQLGVPPAQAIVFEDAVVGVEAGRAGGFGLVVGVARNGGEELARHGADIVVDDVRTIRKHLESDG